MSFLSAAMNMLRRGTELDNMKRYTEALVCYEEGVQMLLDKMEGINVEFIRSYLMKQIDKYKNRVEEIKKIVQELKDNGQYHEQIQIEDDSIGNSYKTLIGRFLDKDVQFVIVEDPYIRTSEQCHNLLRLCELLVKSCKNLTSITVITIKDNKSECARMNCFNNLIKEMLRYNIILTVKYSKTLDARQITLSSGWIIKIGRGLDLYKPPTPHLCIGLYDLDLKPCYKTTVDILYSNNVMEPSD